MDLNSYVFENAVMVILKDTKDSADEFECCMRAYAKTLLVNSLLMPF